MNFYTAPFYTEEELAQLDETEVHFPFSDKDATYIGKDHQYELTSAYFQERGVNLEKKVPGNEPDKVAQFLKELRHKVYLYIYTHNRSARNTMNYLIAKKGLTGYSKYEYRQSFLEAMYTEGCYLLENGDLSAISGVDLETMQNMSADVMRNQDRDMHKDCIRALCTLGLNYFGRYGFAPQGKDW